MSDETSEGVISDSIKTRIAECPLCLQRLKCPRSLPCLHSFCKECLKTSILNQSQDPNEESFFTCPACSVVTRPVDPKQKRDEWAMLFEADQITTKLTTEGGGACEQVNCNPCNRKGRADIVASVWWKEANKYLCESCKKNDLITEDDTLLPINSDFRPSTPQLCDKHSTDVDMICEDHHSICCPKCIAIDHRRCDAVQNYSDFVNKLRSPSQIEDKRDELNDAIDAFTALIKDLKEHIKTLLGNKEGFLDDVKELRLKIEKQLDKLQNALSEEVGAVLVDKKQELDRLIRKCELMKRCITTTKCLTETDYIIKNDMHMVRTFQRGEMEIEAGRTLVKEIAEPYLTWRLTHEKEKKIETNEDDNQSTSDNDEKDESNERADEKNLLSALSLGSLKTTSQERDFPVEASVLLPLSLSGARETHEIEIKTPSDSNDCQVTGLVYLQDGRILVSDNGNEKLKMFSVDGNLLDEEEVSCCRDICMKEVDTVAVTRHSEGVISLVKIESLKKLNLQTENDIRAGKKCDALTLGKDCLVFATSYDSISNEICKVISPDYTKEIAWTYKYVQGLAYDHHTNTILLTTMCDDVSIILRVVGNYDISEVARAGDLLTGASGIDIDQDGNMYICCNDSEKIVQISRHGKVRSLVDMSDPYRIAVCGKKFVVSMKNQGTVKFFEMY
ncbi:uncharacterized protein LOC117344399 [Pecten maximus]|uniref:uncharacterized protein LOC117344399 n=1 Tax=Pecten maximus TaxID=6579 RepID=UPI001458D989|nr:uncharacterized protein LOC117344399 [Pecten maximus]